jgi:hypothetical protein
MTDYRGLPMISPSLQIFTVVPNDAPVFRYAANGDLQGLRSIFHQRLASPSDRTRGGRGPLEVCS